LRHQENRQHLPHGFLRLRSPRMSRPPGPSGWLGAGRRIWRATTPVRLRRAAQPVVRTMMEQRIRKALRGGEPSPTPGPLVLSGLLAEAKGVSEGARLSLAGLRHAGFNPVPHDLRPMFAGAAAPLDGSGGVWFLHVNAPEAVHALGRIDPSNWLGRYRIGYWAYELSRVPPDWVRAAHAFHEIWTPSHFVAAALKDSGVATPIRVMPHPVALGEPAAAPDRAAFNIPADDFAVLAMGDLHSSAARKNLAGAIAIYLRAFPAPGAHRLIVKVREDTPAFLAQVRKLAGSRSDIAFVTGDVTMGDLRRLVASSSVLLSPHRAEGFGLPLAEAFLAGVPALATGWSGNLDFMADLPQLLIASSPVPVRDPYGVYRAPGLVWAEPDVEDAAAKLRVLAASPTLCRNLAAQGKAAVDRLTAAWSRDALRDTPLARLASPVT